MRHNRLSVIAILLVLITACQPPLDQAVVQAPSVYGVGICHWVPLAKPHDAVTWGYETTPAVHWAWLEREKGQFNFSLLYAYIGDRLNSGMKVWLSIQTVGVGADGKRKAPQWLFDEGAVWISGTCSKDGMIAPWDDVYQERLPILLEAINAHIAGWDEAHRNVVAGVIAMSGGMYGEMQVSSCGAKAAMKSYYGLDEAQFNARYGDAIAEIADFYFAAFSDLPVMWQVGYNVTKTDAALEQDVVDYLVMLYSDRLFVKWAGLDPVCGLNWQRRANQYYQDMFKQLSASGVRVGYEPKGVWKYQTPIGSGNWDAGKFEEVFGWAEDASFMCFPPAMISALLDVPGWQQFDAALEANAPMLTPVPTLTATVTKTPIPTKTPEPTMTPTPTSTPEPTRMPTATHTPTVTPTMTPTATLTPTTAPTPMDCWIVVGDQRYRFDCWKE